MSLIESTTIRKTKTSHRMVKVWDPLVRLFHWSLVLTVLAAFFIESPRAMHQALGYTAIGLITVRIIWGFIGRGHARFASFVPGPRHFATYIYNIIRGTEARYLGHNPAGAVMILALLAMIGAIGTTGIMMGMDAWFGEEWVEELHEALVYGLMGLVALHVGGVVLASYRHRENLVAAMFSGLKAAGE